MDHDSATFVETLELALRESLQRFARANPQRALAGIALGTDDDLRSLFIVFADREFFTAPPYPGAQFIFSEWPIGDDSNVFEPAQREIQRRFEVAESAGYDTHIETHVAATFACLVEALQSIRAEGLIGDDVLIVIGSTDPSEASRQRTLRAASELNGPELFAEFLAAQ